MQYNPFRNIYFFPNFKTGHVIQWTVDPLLKEPLPYVFTLEASGTPDFKVIEYSIVGGDVYTITDNTNFKQSLASDLFYRVKLTTRAPSVYYSRTVSFGAGVNSRRKYRLASEITRKELLLSRKFTGIQGWVLKRKAFGAVAMDSVDEISGVPIVDNTSNFGTEFEGGYYDPLAIMFSIEEYQQTRKQSEDGNGVIEQDLYKIRMAGFPVLDTFDVLVDDTGGRCFVIKDQQQDFFPGTDITVSQTLQTQLVAITDPIYQIVIPR